MTDIHSDKILILDFGSQYTQLIARRIRELGVYCEIWAWDHEPTEIAAFGAKGIILSGGPESVHEAGSPRAPHVFAAPADIPPAPGRTVIASVGQCPTNSPSAGDHSCVGFAA